MKNFRHILGATKFEVPLQNFSKVSARAGCGVKIYLGIIMEAYQIFLRLFTINKGSILISSNLVALKRGNPDPILTVKIIEWGRFIDYFGLSIEAVPIQRGQK